MKREAITQTKVLYALSLTAIGLINTASDLTALVAPSEGADHPGRPASARGSEVMSPRKFAMARMNSMKALQRSD